MTVYYQGMKLAAAAAAVAVLFGCSGETGTGTGTGTGATGASPAGAGASSPPVLGAPPSIAGAMPPVPTMSAMMPAGSAMPGSPTVQPPATSGTMTAQTPAPTPTPTPTQTPTPTPAPAPGTVNAPVIALNAGQRPLQRLTKDAYERTVQELLRLNKQPSSGLVDDGKNKVTGFTEAGSVAEPDAAKLQSAAETLAQQAVAGDLSALMGCKPDGGAETACVDKFIRSFGRRAFRRALTETEVSDLKSLYQAGRGTQQMSIQDSVALVLTGMLQAPQLLYSRERATPDAVGANGLERLTPDELASRLSYLFWRSMPDDKLLAAVDSGKLTTAADVEREARRLAADPRSQDTYVNFIAQWFHLPIDGKTALSSSATGETLAFVRGVLGNGAKVEDLLTSSVNYVNQTTAPIYGASAVSGSDLKRVTSDPTQRFGLLTQVNFLGTFSDPPQSHPVKRGNVIYKQLLCGELPPVPVTPPPGPQLTNVSNRERFAAHGQSSCAKGCHSILDPLGFAFENYDGSGKYRAKDAGKDVDASGAVQISGLVDWKFKNARELVDLLATSESFKGCATRQWARFALGRKEVAADEGSLVAAKSAFAASGYDLRELFVSIATTPSFLYRASTPPQGTFP